MCITARRKLEESSLLATQALEDLAHQDAHLARPLFDSVPIGPPCVDLPADRSPPSHEPPALPTHDHGEPSGQVLDRRPLDERLDHGRLSHFAGELVVAKEAAGEPLRALEKSTPIVGGRGRRLGKRFDVRQRHDCPSNEKKFEDAASIPSLHSGLRATPLGGSSPLSRVGVLAQPGLGAPLPQRIEVGPRPGVESRLDGTL